MNTKTRKISKPIDFRTRNLFASCRIDYRGKAVVLITDRGRWTEIGCRIPTNAEMVKFNEWMKRVRAWSRAQEKTKT